MRTLLTANTRPRLIQTHFTSPHALNSSVRRTIIPPLRRKVTLSDAFTILLAPVLTAAFIVDVTEKERRKQAWDKKIAQVQHEVQCLREYESRVCETLQVRANCTNISGQRRTYSTASNVGTATANADDNDDFAGIEVLPSSEEQDMPTIRSSDLQRYENFLATKVGLQLLLHVSTGRHPTANLTIDGMSEATVVPDSIDGLVRHLARVNRELHRLSKDLSGYTAEFSADTKGRRELDTEIAQLTWKCRTGSISIHELAYRYTQAVMQSGAAPSISAYQNLVQTLSTLDADAMTFIAMFPYFKTRQVHHDFIIRNIIQQYGKIKDPGRLQRMLHKLVQPDRGFRLESEWELVTVNGIRVPAPINRRPRTLDALIRAALQGDQPHKARAWATLLMQQLVSTRRLANLFINFLTYCAKHVDWTYGYLWLHRAITWSAFFANGSPQMFPKIIFRMLDLCTTCKQPQYYERILDAAVFAGFNVPTLDTTRPDAFSNQAREIRLDWASRFKLRQERPPYPEEFVHAATIFQTELAKIGYTIQDFIGVTNLQGLLDLMTRDEEPQPSSKLHTMPAYVSGSHHGVRSFERADKQIMKPPPPDEILIGIRTPHNENASHQSELRKQFSELQEAYNSLVEKYQEQQELNDELYASMKKQNISEGKRNTGHDLQELVQRLSSMEERNAQLQDHNYQLQRKVDIFHAQDVELQVQLEKSTERKHELLESIEELKLKLNAVKPKSLESVFLERENLNMRFEMRAISMQYATILATKETLEKEAIASRAQLEKLHQSNEALKQKSESIEAQYEKVVSDSKARQGNLTKILGVREATIRALRAELADSRTTHPGSFEPDIQPNNFSNENHEKQPNGKNIDQQAKHSTYELV